MPLPSVLVGGSHGSRRPTIVAVVVVVVAAAATAAAAAAAAATAATATATAAACAAELAHHLVVEGSLACTTTACTEKLAPGRAGRSLCRRRQSGDWIGGRIVRWAKAQGGNDVPVLEIETSICRHDSSGGVANDACVQRKLMVNTRSLLAAIQRDNTR